jgi:hypothetical protein
MIKVAQLGEGKGLRDRRRCYFVIIGSLSQIMTAFGPNTTHLNVNSFTYYFALFSLERIVTLLNYFSYTLLANINKI